ERRPAPSLVGIQLGLALRRERGTRREMNLRAVRRALLDRSHEWNHALVYASRAIRGIDGVAFGGAERRMNGARVAARDELGGVAARHADSPQSPGETMCERLAQKNHGVMYVGVLHRAREVHLERLARVARLRRESEHAEWQPRNQPRDRETRQ